MSYNLCINKMSHPRRASVYTIRQVKMNYLLEGGHIFMDFHVYYDLR